MYIKNITETKFSLLKKGAHIIKTLWRAVFIWVGLYLFLNRHIKISKERRWKR